MPFLTWSDKYSVGVDAIDRQHQQLVNLINELHDAMLKGNGNDIMVPILDRLVQYTRVHFESEETLMRRAFYPGLDAHKREHETLTRQVVEFQQEVQNGRAMITIKVMNFLKEWLVHHILETDMKYGPHLAERLAH